MKKQTKNRLIKVSIAAVFIIGIYCLWCHLLSDDVIWKNISVNGISLQGKTKQEALDALRENFETAYQNAEMTVRVNDEEYKVNIFPVLDVVSEEIVESAYSLGHGSWYTRGTDRIHLMNSGNQKKKVSLTPSAKHPEKLDEVLSEAGLDNAGTVVQTECRITDTALVITKGKSGLSPDMEKLKDAILNAIAKEDYEAVIDCPLMEDETEAPDFDAFYETVYQEPRSALLDEKTREITPSVTGVSFNVKKAKKRYEAAKEGENIRIEFTLTQPEITTEDLEALPYLDLLGSYTTYGGGTRERITNLELAVKGINGVEVQPGEVFSYNEALGPRTEERGYQMATVIVNGEREPGIGGGICQITTTLFVASLYADLDIVERHNHSARVDYVEDGLDAAVVYGGQDFRFQNNTGYPVKISATYANGAVTVQIYGTKTDSNTVKLSVEETGQNTCTTYRSIFDEAGELLNREQVAYSQYKQ